MKKNYKNASLIIDNGNGSVVLAYQMVSGGAVHEQSFGGMAEAVAFCMAEGVVVAESRCYAVN